MKNLAFITFNDPPSGIYFSQVTDVCFFLKERFPLSVRLISFVSLRRYFSYRSDIKKNWPAALVIPMFPGVNNWRLNRFTLGFILLLIRPSVVIARGPFACSLALSLKKILRIDKVCFDARGAYKAEFLEYDVSKNENLRKEISKLEKSSVLSSDFRLGVSAKLPEYWKKEFGYSDERHCIIPCTLNTFFLKKEIDLKKINDTRAGLGLSDEDILCIYSGSSAAWQSLKMLDDIFYKLIEKDKHVKLLLLTNGRPALKIATAFPKNVMMKWVPHSEIFDMLSAGDYGVLLREPSVTNSVASPTKFAEYLLAGLGVLISENLGDYSEFVKKHGCGIITERDELPRLSRALPEEKKRLHALARQYFSKESYMEQYRKLVEIN